MSVKSLKLRIYQTMIKYLSTTEEEDEVIYKYVRLDYGRLMDINGCFMRFTPNTCIFVIVYNMILFVSTWGGVASMIYTAFLYDLKMDQMVYMINVGALLLISGICHTTFFMHRREAILLYRDLIEAGKYREIDDDFLSQSLRVWKLSMRVWPAIVFALGVSLLTTTTVIDAVSGSESSEDKLPIPIKFPFSTTNNIGYWSAFFIEILVVHCLVVEVGAGLPAYLFVEKIVLELNLLIMAIKTLHERSFHIFMEIKEKEHQLNMCSKRPNIKKGVFMESTYYNDLYTNKIFIECYEKNFRDVIIHHQLTLNIFNHYQTYGGIAILFVIAFSSFMIAISIYCIISNAVSIGLKVATVFVLIPQSLNIWVVCYYGEQTSTLAEQVRYELYFSNWVHCSTGVKRSMRIMQTKTLETISMCGAGFTVKANYDSFCTVVNSAYTYVNLLYAFQK